jgi:hypothetical protein
VSRSKAAECSKTDPSKILSISVVSVAPRYFLRRNGLCDSEVETVDFTTTLGFHALTRRPGRSVGKTDR